MRKTDNKGMNLLGTFSLIEKIIERRNKYLISDQTINELKNGTNVTYKNHVLRHPAQNLAFEIFLDKYEIKPCSFPKHKLIVKRI
jgi:hypothetical protein